MAIHRHQCCKQMTLESFSDFGGRRGFEYTFMRCSACHAWVMDVYWADSNTPNVIDGKYYPAMSRQLNAMHDLLASCVESLDLPDV